VIYDYQCNKCDNKYVRSNTIAHRKKGGRCPECTSSDTKLIMSTPAFKTCTGGAHGGKVI
jgi:putative FmdB family regulatory protein